MPKYVTSTYEIQENFQNVCVAVRDANVVIKTAELDRCTVSCYEKESRPHAVKAENGTLLITCAQKRKWYHVIHLPRKLPQIEICLPKTAHGALTVKCVTGKLTLHGIDCQALTLSGVTGAVTLSNVAAAGDIYVQRTTGELLLSDTTCQNLTLRGKTGAVTLSNVIATGDICIRHTTGKVALNDCDANALSVKVTTGGVSGRLLSEKIFTAKSTTGKISVPNPPCGGKCEIKTTTGSIRFEHPPR